MVLKKLSFTTLFFVIAFILSFVAIILFSFFFSTITKAESVDVRPVSNSATSGDHVVALLDVMRIELRNGTTTKQSFPIISKGVPGSYYETIGGNHTSPYKTPLHFSSIGHVYMPYSVQIFGNYFIHGIPYYPNGQKVTSEYSGGCIRLSDEDAKQVYEFVTKDMPIIVVQKSVDEFSPTRKKNPDTNSLKVTHLMSAIISLELLSQDSPVPFENTISTRRKLLLYLMQDNDTSNDQMIVDLYASSLGEAMFVNAMNKKAASLGMSSTYFESVDQDAKTTSEDIARLQYYISYYKSYIRAVERGK
ncbi:MAG: hypothetical protein RI935_311 [Candidatus Parcubacteria bacterium]|jgi:hypothetical protein